MAQRGHNFTDAHTHKSPVCWYKPLLCGPVSKSAYWCWAETNGSCSLLYFYATHWKKYKAPLICESHNDVKVSIFPIDGGKNLSRRPFHFTSMREKWRRERSLQCPCRDRSPTNHASECNRRERQKKKNRGRDAKNLMMTWTHFIWGSLETWCH